MRHSPRGNSRSVPEDTETIVIGAGIAGLAAARMLHDAGRDVLVLEARQRLGGRMHTDRSLGTAIELGAHWIHGEQSNPIAALARRWGLRTVTTDHAFIPLSPSEANAATTADANVVLYETFPRLLAQAQHLARQLRTDLPLGEALHRVVAGQQRPHLQAWVTAGLAWLSLVMGTDAESLSARHWDQDTDLPGPDLLLPDGYDAIPQRLAVGLDIRYGEVVQRIVWDADPVQIETARATYRAPVVIVTLPLGVLKAGHVAFVPPLPEQKRRAIARLGMGLLNKIILVFAQPFWPEQGEHLANLERRHGELAGFSSLLPATGAPVLVGWIAGREAHELESLGDTVAVERALATLRRLCGASLPEPIHTYVTRWGSDPFACGAYTHIPVGASGADHDRLAAPLAGRLLFAGEATHRAYPGTVHGAYLSGVREARRVLRQCSQRS